MSVQGVCEDEDEEGREGGRTLLVVVLRRLKKLSSIPGRPKTWSPCMCVMKMPWTLLGLRKEWMNWRCVPSPQSKSICLAPTRTPMHGQLLRIVGILAAEPRT